MFARSGVACVRQSAPSLLKAWTNLTKFSSMEMEGTNIWGRICAIRLLLMFMPCQRHLRTQDCLIDAARSCENVRHVCKPTAVLPLAHHTVFVIDTRAARFRRSIVGCLMILWELLQRTREAGQTRCVLLFCNKMLRSRNLCVNSRLLS